MLYKFIIKLLILFVLFSQFATLTHAVEHQFVEDEHEYCSICIHQINSNNLVIDSNNPDHFYHNDDENIAGSYSSFYILSIAVYSARSPPSDLI